MIHLLIFRNLRSFSSIFLLLFLSFRAAATPKTPIGWITKTTGAGEENCSGIETDEAGNVYTIFRYNGKKGTTLHAANGAFQIPANPENYGGSNTVLCSYSPDGNLRWAIKMEGTGTVAGWSMAMGQDQHLYISGNFNRNAVFHTTNGKAEAFPAQKTAYPDQYFYQFFTAKYSLVGELIWLKHGHSKDNMVDFKSVTDKAGNCYSYVHSAGQNVMVDDFVLSFSGANPRFTEHYDVIVPKVNAAGRTEWCFIGGKNSPLYKHEINANQTLDLVFYLNAERNYFFTTNGWDTLMDAPNKTPGYAKITLATSGEIERVEPLFQNVKQGRLLDYVTTASGICAVFVNQDYPTSYGRNRLIVLDKDSVRTTSNDDLFVVFFDTEGKIVTHYRVDGDQNQKFSALHAAKNGKIYTGFLATPNTAVWSKNSAIAALTAEREYAYHFLQFSESGAFEQNIFAGNYGYDGYEKHLHLATFDDYLAIGVELGMASTIAGVEEKVDGYLPSWGNKIYTTDAALLYVKATEKKPVVLNLNALNHKTISLDSVLIVVKDVLATANNLSDSILGNLTPPNLNSPAGEPITAEAQLDQYEVFLFPNPVSKTESAVTLRLSNAQEKQLEWSLVASNGLVVQSGKLLVDSPQFETRLQFQNLSAGLYFLRIQIEKELVVKRLVVF